MVTKNIFKIVNNNRYSRFKCKIIINEIAKHINKNEDKMYTQDNYVLMEGNALALTYSAIKEGKVEVDVRELKRRTSTADLCELVKEMKKVAKLAEDYKRNKDNYMEF